MDKIIDLAARRDTDKATWFAQLRRSKDGAVLPSVANAMIIGQNDPDLAGMFAYNEFAHRPVIQRCPPPAPGGATTKGPFPRAWEGADVTLVQSYLQLQYGSRFTADTVQAAMEARASLCGFHPVKDWLNSLVWDGEPRLQFWLSETFGCPQDIYHGTVAVKFCVAAVRRIRQPGCKFDSVLILEGKQRLGKSLACRTLAGDEWFTDTLPSLSNGRDCSAALEGVWIVELAEIEHLIRAESETVKAFLSRQVERYSPKYIRGVVDRARQCVFIGTTNKDDYGRDATGNTRYWPVRCEAVDIGWLAEYREQLWAEAAFIEATGERLWLEDAETRAVATLHQERRAEEDPWAQRVIEWASGFEQVKIPDILSMCLNLPTDKQNKAAEMRVADILRRGDWEKDIGWKSGKTFRYWISPSETVKRKVRGDRNEDDG